jgi:hypothetical protein
MHILRTYYCNLLSMSVYVCIYYIRNMYPDRVFTPKKRNLSHQATRSWRSQGPSTMQGRCESRELLPVSIG